MISYVLTLVGNARTAVLGNQHIDRVCQQLKVKGQQDWLARDEACDLFFESPLCGRELSQQALIALSDTEIDAVCTPVKERRRKLLISDMDSTIIDQECIDELGDAIGCGPRIREITAAVVSGQVSFSDALRERLALMKGMEHSLLEKVYLERIKLKKGARTLVQTMRQDGAYCVLVSGGFSFFTQRIAANLGFHEHQGNELLFANGKLTGAVKEPILGRSAKLRALEELCDKRKIYPSDVLAVGDGSNDIKMIRAAGLGVAFHGSASLRQQANACISYGDLTALLYIQGFHSSQFVLS